VDFKVTAANVEPSIPTLVNRCQFQLKPDQAALAQQQQQQQLQQQQGDAEQPYQAGETSGTGATPTPADPDPQATEKSPIVPKSKSHEDFGKLRQNLREFPVLRRFEPGNGVIWAVVALGLALAGLSAVLIYGFSELKVRAGVHQSERIVLCKNYGFMGPVSKKSLF
jgi:hypothetical protein